jgi:uncharacterized protein
MQFLIIPVAALLVSGLTLFSGFGLGTLLMPLFAVFFPVEVAIALTAIVHGLNNLFKLVLLGSHIDRRVVLRFGLPAIAAAFAGAGVLTWLSGMPPLFDYTLGGRRLAVEPIKLVVAVLMALFGLFEVVPRLQRVTFGPRHLPVGGLLSGFFGGLSGHQGALRSAFLVRAGLTKEAFIASGVAIACLIDAARLSVYSVYLAEAGLAQNWPLLALSTAAAFAGAFAGSRLIRKVTLPFIQLLVSVMLFAVAVALGAGLI